MASQPIANYFTIGPSGADNLDSSYHGRTPLDSAEVGFNLQILSIPTIVMDKKIGLNPPFYKQGFINLKTTITQIQSGGGEATPTPGWED